MNTKNRQSKQCENINGKMLTQDYKFKFKADGTNCQNNFHGSGGAGGIIFAELKYFVVCINFNCR